VTNNDNDNSKIKESRKLNIVSTIDHSIIRDRLISNADVQRMVGSYRQIINNVLQREHLINNNTNEVEHVLSNNNNNNESELVDHEDREAYFVLDENNNDISNSNNNNNNNNGKDKEKDCEIVLKMENNYLDNDALLNDEQHENKSNSSNASSNEHLIIENLENDDIYSDVEEAKAGLIPSSNTNNNNESILIENEKKNNESSIHSSNNSLNSTDHSLINNSIYSDDVYSKKSSLDANKNVNRNNSSSSESLVEKFISNDQINKENVNLDLNKSSNNKLQLTPENVIISIASTSSTTSNILPNFSNYFSKVLINNSSLVNSELNKNTQNFIFLKQLKPTFSFSPYSKTMQVSIDCEKYFNLSPTLTSNSLSLIPLKKYSKSSSNRFSVQFNLNSSEKLSQVLLFLWNLNSSKLYQSQFLKSSTLSQQQQTQQQHHHKSPSVLQMLIAMQHIQFHIQQAIDDVHALSCHDYLTYLWSLQQYQLHPNCTICQLKYTEELQNHSCTKCQHLITEQLQSCQKCLEMGKLSENRFKIGNLGKSIQQEEINKAISEIKEMFAPQKKIPYKLDTLPPEILLNIFDQFSNTTDKQNFRFTCTRFRKALDSPNVLMIQTSEQFNYLKKLINVKNAVMNVDILFKDLEKLEINDTTFSQIKNLILLCDIQDLVLFTNEYSKKIINTAFSSFTTLTNLTIRQVSRRDIFSRLFSPRQLILPSLKHLQFEESILSPKTLKPWEKISMPSLESVVIDEKSVLSHIPSFLRNASSIELKCHFRNDLWMSGEYNNLETLIVELDYKDDFNELFIKENTYMPQLKSLLLMNNKKVESLPISPKLSELTIVCDEFTKEELNRLPEYYPELSVLNIESPLDFSFPSTFTSLKSLRLEFIPTILIRTIPAMPHLTSLHIERGEHVVLNGAFPELKYLIVESCDKINFTGKFQAVEWIKFRNCNNLRSIDWEFPSLNSLSLEGCFFLTSIADKYPLLQTLNVKCCKNFYKIPNNLTKLNTLNILQCDNFISVSSNFKALTMLNVSHCRIFSYVPKELENLEWLLLEDCNNIHQIPHLSKLRHFKCLRCKNIPFPFSPCKFFPNIRSFAVTTLNKN